MALLFVGGVMNVLWIALLALLVLLEKLTPFGRWVARAAGLACMAAGAWICYFSGSDEKQLGGAANAWQLHDAIGRRNCWPDLWGLA